MVAGIVSFTIASRHNAFEPSVYSFDIYINIILAIGNSIPIHIDLGKFFFCVSKYPSASIPGRGSSGSFYFGKRAPGLQRNYRLLCKRVRKRADEQRRQCLSNLTQGSLRMNVDVAGS